MADRQAKKPAKGKAARPAKAVEKIDKASPKAGPKAGPKAPGKNPVTTGLKPDRRGTPKGKATRKRPNGSAIGNPPHVPSAVNRRIVETHAAVGTPQWVIAELLEISERTLERHYDRELKLGLHKMNARVGSGIAKKALKGEDGYDKFWISRRGGAAWASKAQTELSTPPGRPLETRDMTGLSVEELRILAKIDARPSAGD